jgi:hypothetical protein
MIVKFDSVDYQAKHGDTPAGYANQWIFSLAMPVDYAGKAGLDYLILDDMDWQDAKVEATNWAIFNGEDYETIFVSKDSGSTYAPVWGN